VDPSAPPAAGLVGPLGSSSFSLPTVERALAEMEGGSSGQTLGIGRRAGAPTSPIIGSVPSPTGQTQHEVLQNFFKSLLNTKDRAGGVSPGTSAVSPGVGPSKVPPTGPRTSGGGAVAGSTQADAGSGTEDG
jgi:dynein light intermediate chain 1